MTLRFLLFGLAALIAGCAPQIDLSDQAAVSEAIQTVTDDETGKVKLTAPRVSLGAFGDKSVWLSAERDASQGSWTNLIIESSICCNPGVLGIMRLNGQPIPFSKRILNQSISNLTYIGTTPVVTVTPMNIGLIEAPIDIATLEEGANTGLKVFIMDTTNGHRYNLIMPPAYVTAYLLRLQDPS